MQNTCKRPSKKSQNTLKKIHKKPLKTLKIVLEKLAKTYQKRLQKSIVISPQSKSKFTIKNRISTMHVKQTLNSDLVELQI
jgi:hypothetical protein